MLKLRLIPGGQKHKIVYRLGIMKATTKRNGLRFQNIGFYNPRTKDLKIDIISLIKNLKCGVQPTKRILFILIKLKIISIIS
jgi:small subunit ribosomal protein S16